ncbi:MAG TPA: DUF2164 domain-containing protein [Gemmatimonadaceae bacterium]|jgi:uncharacterized protein (DUF2164 family)|nr:DUF2164 domain-containing protein [Gemmatimonadaceae bacterium]
MSITLSPDATRQLKASIQRYVAEQLDLDIGDLQADLLLDFIVREAGPAIYNQAIADAQAFMRDRVADLESVCYEPEFTYWAQAARRTGRK